MERVYYKRDRRIVVDEVPDVRAVRVGTDERGALRVSAEAFGAPAVDAVRSRLGSEFAEDEDPVLAFQRANWAFVTPSPEISQALAAGESVRDAEEVGKVVVGRGGSLSVVTNRLNVQLRPELSTAECEAVLAEKNLDVAARLAFAPNLYEVDARGREDALAASVELHDDPRFTLAEPSFIEHIPQRFTPSDPRYADQWQWHNTGQAGGTAGADVSAEEAWDRTRGAGVRVALIDNGFQAGHEDLAAAVSPVSGFFRQDSGGTRFVQGTAGMPDSEHGTFCAGMVGARHNNGRGGCGIAPECQLTLIACLGDQVGTQTTLARAVAYAGDPRNEGVGTAADGADILVSSLGPNVAMWDLTVTLELALEAVARNGRGGRGMAIFWAASNGFNADVTLDEVVSHEDVIAVVRSDRNDLENNAARGRTVDLIAPGVDVFSTASSNGYRIWTGTSFAAPCAAGCAALALSVNRELTRDALRAVMFESADKIGGVVYDAVGHNDDYGFGRVNADRAVAAATPHLHTIQGAPAFLRVHDLGTGWGPSADFLDVEAIVRLDSAPEMAFGFQLREDGNEEAHRQMLDVLRGAFRHGRRVSIDYYARAGARNGRAIRVAEIP